MEMAASKEPSLKRKPNWNEDECLFLAELVEERKEVIKGKFGPKVTSAMKRTAWSEISEMMNESFPRTTREPIECERKWYVIQSRSRPQKQQYKKELRVTGELDISMCVCILRTYIFQ